MKVTIRNRNIQSPEKVKSYVEKRLGKLERIIDKDAEASVTLVGEKNRQRIEITIPVNGFILRGEEESDDIFTAIDLVTDKLEKQMVRSKERFSKKGLLPVTKLSSMIDISPAKESDDDIKVRTKRFSSKPMMLDEAITSMDMVGHSFFVFNNAETGAFNVVYRRHDGHYGVLEPEA